MYSGDASDNISTSPALLQRANSATATATTTALVSSLNPSVYGQSVTLTANVAPSTATGTVTFLDGSTVAGTGTITAGAASLTVAAFAVGAHSLTAAYGGDTNNATSISPFLTETVLQAGTTTQTITFGPIGSAVIGAQPVTLSAAASSGLAVAFASNTPSVCTVSGASVTLLTIGTCSITASQPGSSVYAAATPVNQTFAITYPSQTITFAPVSNKVIGTQPFTLSATASSGYTVTVVSNTTSVCTVSGTTVTLLAQGTCSITASQSGDGMGTLYAAATPVTRTFLVTAPTITFDAIPNQILGVSPFPVDAFIVYGQAVGFSSASPTVCKTADSLVTLLKSGTCSITASSSSAASVTNGFTVSPATSAGTLAAAPGSPIAVGAGTGAIASGDFNGDGIRDLVTANEFGNSLTILLGNGSGGFAPAAGGPIAVSGSPGTVVVGDFNGDGIPDIATASFNNNDVTVLLGNGSGGFTAAAGSPFTVGTGPNSLAVGDFNGDGIPDLATANSNSNNVTVLLGNGSGGFNAATGSPFAAGSFPVVVVAGDFNGDGIQDLAAANESSNNVTVLLGNGKGGFTAAAASPFAVGNYPYSVAVGDFNEDGVQDLVTANGGDDTVTVLLGTGPGGFTAAAGSPFKVGSFPESVVVGDFNGDGIQVLPQPMTTATAYQCFWEMVRVGSRQHQAPRSRWAPVLPHWRLGTSTGMAPRILPRQITTAAM